MAADSPAPTMPDSRPLHRLIASTRVLLRSAWVTTGVAVTVGLLFGTLVVLAVLDLFVPLEPFALPLIDVTVTPDPILRSLALFFVVVPAALAFFQGVVRPLFRRLTSTQVARRIETKLPGIHNRLVSAIDLETNAAQTPVSPTFLRRLLTEALDRIKGFRASSLLDLKGISRACLAAGVAVALSVTAWGLYGDRLPTALSRIFMPWADIPPASGVAYAVEPGTTELLRAEPMRFVVRVAQGEPDAMRLEMTAPGSSRRVTRELKPDANEQGVWTATLDGGSLGTGFEDGFRYRVYGGRTWSKRHAVTLIDRPVIAGVTTSVRYPKYMKLPEAQPTPPQAEAVAGPEGADVEIAVASKGEVSEGEIQTLRPGVAVIPRDRQQEKALFADKLPVGSTPEGSWNWTTVAGRRVHTEVGSPAMYGHWYTNDPVGVAVGKGDVLFAHVRVPAGKGPQTLLLEWHDGDGWEHRAYWGKEPTLDGKRGTASRHHAGELPQADTWARLEVPAAKVAMEGRTIRGMAFKMLGGQAAWGRSGTVQVEEPTMDVVARHALRADGEDRWVGKLPSISGEGLFRAELRRRAGDRAYPNKTMKEIRYISLPDRPPYVALDRKGNETVLSKAAAVPLSLAAFDDYGLDEVAVSVRPTAEASARSRVLWSAGDKPLRTLSLEASLTESAALGAGGSLRVRVVAKDTKGQTAESQEFVVRVAADGTGDDRKLENLEKTQDTFADRLTKLLAEQRRVKEKIDKLADENAKLTGKLDELREEARAEAEKGTDEKTKPEKKPEDRLTKEEKARLAELQKELAKLAAEENKVAADAEKIAGDLKAANDEAAKTDLLPRAVTEQMNNTQDAFKRLVADAMRNLNRDLDKGSKPNELPNVGDIRKQADRVGKEIEGIKDRLDALANARKGLKEDLEKTLAALRDKMAAEGAKMTARDLEELKDFLNKLREQANSLKGKQDDLDGAAEKGLAPKQIQEKQEDLDAKIERLLAKAKKLLKGGKDKGDDPEFPAAPFRAEGKEDKVPPREADTDDDLPGKKKGKDAKTDKDGGKSATEKKGDEEDEKKFMPRLGGNREKLDPRYKDKQRPVNKKNKDGDDETGDKTGDKSDDKSSDLDAVGKSAKADVDTLDDLLNKLGQKADGKQGKSGEKGDDKEGSPPSPAGEMARQLEELMSSKSLKEAMMMAAAAKAMGKGDGKGKSKEPSPPQPSPPSGRDVGNLDGNTAPPGKGEEGLAKLDPATRGMILKLPPSRYREELIRGLGEQGPEAYRAHIRDYFRRLTEEGRK